MRDLTARYRASMVEPPFQTTYYDLLDTKTRAVVGSLQLTHHEDDPARPKTRPEENEKYFQVTLHQADESQSRPVGRPRA